MNNKWNDLYTAAKQVLNPRDVFPIIGAGGVAAAVESVSGKMKEEYYQIGEVSRITGISKDTLHIYTKIGMVNTDYVNPENHYHYYSRWNMYHIPDGE